MQLEDSILKWTSRHAVNPIKGSPSVQILYTLVCLKSYLKSLKLLKSWNLNKKFT